MKSISYTAHVDGASFIPPLNHEAFTIKFELEDSKMLSGEIVFIDTVTPERANQIIKAIVTFPKMLSLLQEYYDRFQPMKPNQTEWQGRVCNLLTQIKSEIA